MEHIKFFKAFISGFSNESSFLVEVNLSKLSDVRLGCQLYRSKLADSSEDFNFLSVGLTDVALGYVKRNFTLYLWWHIVHLPELKILTEENRLEDKAFCKLVELVLAGTLHLVYF